MKDADDTSPILIVPYMWIGDFVRGHTVVRVLNQRWPNRPVDLLTTSLCAPLVDYMPGVRAGLVCDLPRSRLALATQWALAAQFRERGYRTALILPRTWKAALAPALAGIPERIGFVGEARFGLLNRWRWGEKALPRFIDKNAALALPDGAPVPPEWPVPELRVPAADAAHWRQANGLGVGPAIALAPGSVGASKRWTYYPEAARLFAEKDLDVWVVGGPSEKALAAEIVAAGGDRVRDLTGTDLRNGILAMAAARLAISNDSGLMHIADHGHFRAHRPLPLGAIERARGHRANQDSRAVPALPSPGLPHERPSLHARYPGCRCRRHRSTPVHRGRCACSALD
jgi:heptosyltransferase II